VDTAGALRALLASPTENGWLLRLGRGLFAFADHLALVYDGFAPVRWAKGTWHAMLLSVLRYESGRLVRMHWTTHCSTSHLIQAEGLP
jgi:hypothetical protein